MSIDTDRVSGLGARDDGQVVVHGELLEFEQRLDRVFVDWATAWNAEEYRFPAFMKAEHLARLDYFRSFPHLATFPVTLDSDPENLRTFAAREMPAAHGEVTLTETSALRHVLTPAACYHIYAHIEGTSPETARYFTTRATCFRREANYETLERLWNFSMREIVCIGTSQEVELFLEAAGARATRFVEALGLNAAWETATDPFFRPQANPQYLYQKLEPVKRELVFEQRLAIGSTNFHHRHFGEAFSIRRNGEAASSGCIAFGIERWLSVFINTFGPHVERWPHPGEIDV